MQNRTDDTDPLQRELGRCADIVIDDAGPRFRVAYCPSLSDMMRIELLIVTVLMALPPDESPRSRIAVPLRPLEDNSAGNLVDAIFSGHVLIYDRQWGTLLAGCAPSFPNRDPGESNLEASIRGPRDGFIEDVQVNTGLVRRRLKSLKLRQENFTLGEETKTKIVLLHMEGISRPDVMHTIRQRLKSVRTDALLNANHLAELTAGSGPSLFPHLVYSGRPDMVVESLVNGRFAILVDGTPAALIGPANLALLIRSPEDSHSGFLMSSFLYTLRLLSLFLSFFLPGLYVALATFHPEQLPFQLLSTIVLARAGIPISLPVEMFIVLILLELFREAGVRLPKSIGLTLTVIGGLIIGDAALRAGFTSPVTLVVAALTLVAGSTLVSNTLSGTVSVFRFGIFLFSAMFGIYGFLCSLLGVVVYLAQARSFGVPYLVPFSPVNWGDLLSTVLPISRKSHKHKPSYVAQKHTEPDGGEVDD